MVKLFLGAWLLYGLIFVLMPFEVPARGNLVAIAVIATFLLVVTAACKAAEAGPSDRHDAFAPRNPDLARLVWLGILLSAIGLVSLIYDRLAIQEIDFSAGLAAARMQWMEQGESRTAPSSVFSVAGYLFGSLYFASLTTALGNPDMLSRRQMALLLASVATLAVLNSALAGGRSTLLLLIGFAVAALVLSGRYDWRRLAADRRMIGLWALIAAAMLAYVLYIGHGRAVRVHAAFDAYLLESADYLRVGLSPWYVESLRTSDLAGLTSPFVLIGLYLTHSYAVLCEIVSVPAGDETILFTHWLRLLSKLGLAAAPDDDWFLAGRLSSLPGALFFQYGWQGVIAGSAVLGAASGLSVRLFRRHRGLIPVEGFQACCATILMLSPVVFAADFLAFPFIILGYLMMGLMQLALRREGRS